MAKIKGLDALNLSSGTLLKLVEMEDDVFTLNEMGEVLLKTKSKFHPFVSLKTGALLGNNLEGCVFELIEGDIFVGNLLIL